MTMIVNMIIIAVTVTTITTTIMAIGAIPGTVATAVIAGTPIVLVILAIRGTAMKMNTE
jgi:hypothetical protein